MNKEDSFDVEGEVIGAVGTNFQVRLDEGHIVEAYTAGRMQKNQIRVVVGDKVTVRLNRRSMTPHDKWIGRIVHRHSSKRPLQQTDNVKKP